MGTFIDLTGQRFGHWVVLYRDKEPHKGTRAYWICQCDCGTIRSVQGTNLRNGKSTSCGCLTNGVKDLTGQQFRDWTVIERDYNNKIRTDAYWICKCSCGTIRSVRSADLRKNKSTNCGCKNIKYPLDLTGMQFGNLTILYKDENIKTKHGMHSHWICKCKCGDIDSYDRHQLINGSVHSCGCSRYSKGEDKISQLLKENNIKFESQKYFTSCKIPESNQPLRFDFYLPDYNTIIEYDGKQHFKPIQYFGGEEGFKKRQFYDSFKNNWCKQNNIKIIRIPYTHYEFLTKQDLLPESSLFIIK